MQIFLSKRSILILILLGLSLFLISCSAWRKVTQGTIGENVKQDFSKENIVFTITTSIDSTPPTKINLNVTKPQNLTITDYVIGTEWHYDKDHYLVIEVVKKNKLLCYKYKINARR